MPIRQTSLCFQQFKFLLAVIAAAALFPAMPLFGQGTMGTVPDPISSRELQGYADRMELSQPQRQAIETLHDQYRQEFAVLRERDIEKFIKENRAMGGGPMAGMGMLTDRKAVEKTLKELEEIQNKIKSLDNHLFDQVQTVLTEEQMTRLPQARQARERARYRTGLNRLTAFMNPAAQIDLSEILMDMTLSPQERETAGPLIAQYESSLTSGARKLFESTNSMIMDALDTLQKQMEGTGSGLNEETMRDPQRRGQMFQAVRTIMGDMQKKLGVKAGELSDLNRRSLRSITAALSPEHARSLRDQFYQQAYAEIGAGNSGGGSPARAFDIAYKFKDPALTDEQRLAIAALSDDYFANLDRLTEQAMDAIDENRKTQSFFDFDQESRRKFQEQLSTLRDKRTRLNETTLTTLRASLSPEMTEQLNKRLADSGKGNESEGAGQVITMVGGPGGAAALSVTTRLAPSDSENQDPNATAYDPYLAAPITKSDIEGWSTRLKLAAEDQTVLNSLHTDYLEKHRAIEADQYSAVREAERQLWAMDPNSGQLSTRSPTAIDELYTLRRKAFDSVVSLDRQFFDDVTLAVGENHAVDLKRMQIGRQRQILARAGGAAGVMLAGRAERGGGRGGDRGPGGMRFMGPGMSGGGESSVDLAAIVNSLNPPIIGTEAPEFQTALNEYENASLAVFQKMYDANLRMGAARDKMVAQSMRADGDRESRTVQNGEGTRATMETESRGAGEAKRAVSALNKSTLNTLMATLTAANSAGESQRLRRAYFEKAYPAIFRDSNSADRHLNAALNLPALTEQQRSQIQEMAMEFRSQYDHVTERMIQLEETAAEAGDPMSSPRGGRDGGGWQNFQEQMRTREKIDFDRNDLNDKTVTKLRGVLNEQQIHELGLDRDEKSES